MSETKGIETARPRPATTSEAPAAIGPYAQAQRFHVGGAEWIYTSGQLGLDPASGALVEGGVEPEAERALANLEAVLSAAGFGFGDVVKTTIYLADLEDFQRVNEIYARALGEARPARSTVQVAGLPKGGRVEIEMIAVRPLR